jgi:hypothetical protein
MTSTPAIQPFFSQLRSRVIVPTLQKMAAIVPALDGSAARNLVLGTAAQETGGKYLAQWPTGPGCGLWQMEPATRDDIVANFLPRFPTLQTLVESMRGIVFDPDDELVGNLHYGCAITRLFYYRIQAKLPAPSDVTALGQYWKTYYNTAAGAGTVDQFVTNFHNIIGAPPDV